MNHNSDSDDNELSDINGDSRRSLGPFRRTAFLSELQRTLSLRSAHRNLNTTANGSSNSGAGYRRSEPISNIGAQRHARNTVSGVQTPQPGPSVSNRPLPPIPSSLPFSHLSSIKVSQKQVSTGTNTVKSKSPSPLIPPPLPPFCSSSAKTLQKRISASSNMKKNKPIPPVPQQQVSSAPVVMRNRPLPPIPPLSVSSSNSQVSPEPYSPSAPSYSVLVEMKPPSNHGNRSSFYLSLEEPKKALSEEEEVELALLLSKIGRNQNQVNPLTSNESGNSRVLCQICCENHLEYALVSCGHSFCGDCISRIRRCSFCCSEDLTKIRIYVS